MHVFVSWFILVFFLNILTVNALHQIKMNLSAQIRVKWFFFVVHEYNLFWSQFMYYSSELFNVIALAVVVRPEVNYTEPVCD